MSTFSSRTEVVSDALLALYRHGKELAALGASIRDATEASPDARDDALEEQAASVRALADRALSLSTTVACVAERLQTIAETTEEPKRGGAQ